ncbi:MAG: hypothetical protein HKM93_06370 [Desulfobacteraceae bacterium]|nr:hypothetical protein [Desulfobacteraceae bacterium]
MEKAKHISTLGWLFLIIAGMTLAGCAGSQPKPGEVFPCVADGKLDKEIASEAELTDFSCVFKKFEGSDVVHFTVGVKNVSDQPQRFRVNIFLDNGKAVGGLIPRKLNNGLVAPGQGQSFTYPVTGMTTKPKGITLIIRTMSQ